MVWRRNSAEIGTPNTRFDEPFNGGNWYLFGVASSLQIAFVTESITVPCKQNAVTNLRVQMKQPGA